MGPTADPGRDPGPVQHPAPGDRGPSRSREVHLGATGPLVAADPVSGSAGPETGRATALDRFRVALIAAAAALTAAVAGLAFWVSFEAISAYVTRIGALPDDLRYAGPLLVDSFTVLATVFLLWLALAGRPLRKVWDAWYAWSVIIVATAASAYLNAAHVDPAAPTAAFWVAGAVPVTLLASVHLLVLLLLRLLAGHPHARPVWGPIPTPLGHPVPDQPDPNPDPEPEADPDQDRGPGRDRSRVAQGAVRRPRPATRGGPPAKGRPFTPADHEQVQAWVDEGRTNKAAMARDLGLHKRGQLELGRYVNRYLQGPVQVTPNGQGGGS